MKNLMKFLPLLLAFSVNLTWAQTVCSGHGKADRTSTGAGKCVCETNYTGAKCDVQVAPTSSLLLPVSPVPTLAYCQNGGTQNRDGTCTCTKWPEGTAHYKGTYCEILVPRPPPPPGLTPS